MDRRAFLHSLVGGLSMASAVRTWPFRVYSFPSKIVLARFDDPSAELQLENFRTAVPILLLGDAECESPIGTSPIGGKLFSPVSAGGLKWMSSGNTQSCLPQQYWEQALPRTGVRHFGRRL